VLSLGVIASILTVAIIASWRTKEKGEEATLPHTYSSHTPGNE
jgi:hypothetical protein